MRLGRRLHNLLTPTRRPLPCGLALLGYLVAILGLPLPRLPAREPVASANPCLTPSCCCATAEQCAVRCCCAGEPGAPGESTSETVSAADSESAGAGVRWVPVLQSRACQGLESLWLSLATAVALPVLTSWSEELPAGEWLHVPAARLESLTTPPTDPPPRV